MVSKIPSMVFKTPSEFLCIFFVQMNSELTIHFLFLKFDLVFKKGPAMVIDKQTKLSTSSIFELQSSENGLLLNILTELKDISQKGPYLRMIEVIVS